MSERTGGGSTTSLVAQDAIFPKAAPEYKSCTAVALK
jgi:hypothetical protein